MRRLFLIFTFVLFVSAWVGYLSFVHAGGNHAGGHDDPHGPSGGTLHSVGVKLGQQFTFEPVQPALKNHIWMKTDTDKVSFFHFAKPVSAKKINYSSWEMPSKAGFVLKISPKVGRLVLSTFIVPKSQRGANTVTGERRARKDIGSVTLPLESLI